MNEYMNSIFFLLTLSVIFSQLHDREWPFSPRETMKRAPPLLFLFFKEPAFGIDTDTFYRGLFELLIFKAGS